MSRGLGSVQRAALEYLRSEPFGRREEGTPVSVSTWWIAEVVYKRVGRRNPDRITRSTARATEAERTAMRRALLGLEQRGLVERRGYIGTTSYWLRPVTAQDATAAVDYCTERIRQIEAEFDAEYADAPDDDVEGLRARRRARREIDRLQEIAAHWREHPACS
jgi:hypothetical protein